MWTHPRESPGQGVRAQSLESTDVNSGDTCLMLSELGLCSSPKQTNEVGLLQHLSQSDAGVEV
jgi:hypothetical protein